MEAASCHGSCHREGTLRLGQDDIGPCLARDNTAIDGRGIWLGMLSKKADGGNEQHHGNDEDNWESGWQPAWDDWGSAPPSSDSATSWLLTAGAPARPGDNDSVSGARCW